MMADRLVLERVTASDLFLLLWDDYGWCTDVGGSPSSTPRICSTTPVASGSR
jgi:hypothetical protein